MNKIKTSLVLACIVACTVSQALAALSYNFEFESEPDSQPSVFFYNNTAVARASLYSLGGGLMEQTTLGQSGSTGFGYFDVPGGLLDSSLATTIEARIRVNEVGGGVGTAGLFFQAFDGLHRFSVFFSAGGVSIPTLTGFDTFALDTSAFHTYRMESAGVSGSARFYIDGTLMDSISTLASSLNGFNFGDGETAPGGNATWDYVRFSQTPVPEPSTYIAGALLFLPFGAHLLRRLRTRN